MPNHKVALLLLTLLLTGLAGCTSLEDYQDSEPNFQVESFFNGPLVARGYFKDYSGKVVRRFHVAMQGSWQGHEGILDEQFLYDDGSSEQRIWKLTKLADGRYRGTAADIKGEAIGRSEGFALNWQYVMKLPVDDSVYEVRFDDWMYQLDDQTVINQATVRKFGLPVGEVVLIIQQVPTEAVQTTSTNPVRVSF